MKINDRLRYPHPVLTPFNDDFGQFGMTLDITVQEIPATSALSLNCAVLTDHPQLNSSIQQGLVDCYANVVCLPTYFNEFYRLSNGESTIEIPPGRLHGLTQVRPICVAAADIDIADWKDVHPEFSHPSCYIPKWSVLALGDEFRMDVGLDKLRPMESIFRLAKQESLEEGEIAVDVDSQCIRIGASPGLYSTINALRHAPATRDVLLNSVYFAASLQVLAWIRDDPNSFQEKWWFRVFSARCTRLGITVEDGDLLNDVQAVLNRPLARLRRLQEVME